MSARPHKSTSFRQIYAMRARLERDLGLCVIQGRRLTGSRCAPAGAAAAGARAGQNSEFFRT